VAEANPALSVAFETGIVVIVVAAAGSVLVSVIEAVHTLGSLTVPGVIVLTSIAASQALAIAATQELSFIGARGKRLVTKTALLKIKIPAEPKDPAWTHKC